MGRGGGGDIVAAWGAEAAGDAANETEAEAGKREEEEEQFPLTRRFSVPGLSLPRRAIDHQLRCEGDTECAWRQLDVAQTRREAKLRNGLALGELEAFARSGLARFFAFFHARVATEKALFFEGGAQLRISLNEGTGDGEADSADLAEGSAAVCVDAEVVFLELVGGEEGKENVILLGDGGEIFFVGAVIDGDGTGSRFHADASDSGFSPACGVNNGFLGHAVLV